MAIGNLTSQLFANVYLDSLDKYIKYCLWFRYYGRYVDDFVIFHQDKQKLLDAIPHIKKSYRSYLRKRTIGKFYRKIQAMQTVATHDDKEETLSVINSYLWLLSHHKHYRIAKKILNTANGKIKNTFLATQDYTKIKYRVKKLKQSEIKKLYPQWYYHGNLR